MVYGNDIKIIVGNVSIWVKDKTAIDLTDYPTATNSIGTLPIKSAKDKSITFIDNNGNETEKNTRHLLKI